jgi:predicted anti-sigma-YlaC factor YlaD
MQRLGLSWRKAALLSVALAVIVFVSITAVGLPGGILSAIAIGTATAVAAFSDSRRDNCVPRFLRRRRT